MATGQSSTLAKGLQLLRAVVADRGRSTLPELAARAGMPLPTAHRLVLTLESEGFVERAGRGCYLPGAALGEGQVGGAEQRLALRLRQPLRRLAERHGVLGHFGVLEDGMVTYLVKEGGNGQALFTAEQMQLEAYCSGIGKVLLAALPPEQLEDYLGNEPFVALTSRTITAPDQLRRELAAVREQDVAFDRFEVREDLYCVAVPVRNAEGRVLGGLSASFLGEMPDAARIAALQRALRRLASSAGGSVTDQG